MVYRGKPSTGCKKCRQRKIKCDERSGGCIKCATKGLICPGYENSVDLYFHDESAAVQVKAEKAKAKAIIAREEREKAFRAKAVLAKLEKVVGMPMFTPMIDQAISFFMLNMAWGLDSPPVHSKYYNQHLSTHGFHPVIATCMTALGMAGVANICMDIGLKRESTKWYADALKMTNKAIMDPEQVTSDNTLFATMLLGVFESTTNDKSFVGWANHVSGSASLLRIRGRQQFETPAGRRMWLQVIGLLTLQCMGMGEGLPSFVHDYNKEVDKWEDTKDPGVRFFHLHIATIELRARILKNKLTDLRTIVDRALELDVGAKEIITDMGKDWSYETEYCDLGTPGVFATSYHIYPHLAAAQTWNWIRYTRIYLHDLIRNSLIAGFSTSPPIFAGMEYIRLLESSTDALYRMQADIMASIPQYLHDTPRVPTCYTNDPHQDPLTAPISPPRDIQNHPSTTRSASPASPTSPFSRLGFIMPPSSSPFVSSPTTRLFTANFLQQDAPNRANFRFPGTPQDRLPVIRVSGGYSSIWALYIAGATPIATPESQEFIIHTLLRASAEFGINQAKLLASTLKLKIESDKREGTGMAWHGGLGGKGGSGMGIAPMYMPMAGPHLSREDG